VLSTQKKEKEKEKRNNTHILLGP